DSADRGLYKTSDGGKTWKQVLKGANLSTGCTDIAIDPANANTIFACLWDFRRKGWEYRSGGDGPDKPSASGLFRSNDGGETWSEVTSEASKGFPKKPYGWLAVFKEATETRTTSGSIRPIRKPSSPETMAGCGTPTTAAVNGGKAKTFPCRSFIM